MNKYECDNLASIGTKNITIRPEIIPQYLFEKKFFCMNRHQFFFLTSLTTCIKRYQTLL